MDLRGEMDQLAQNCLQLEKQIQKYEEHIKDQLGVSYTSVALFYDTGSGFCEANKKQVPFVGLEKNRVEVSFCLPEETKRLRLDPGEDACYVSNVVLTPGLRLVCMNGIEFQPGSYLFPEEDPIFYLEGGSQFPEGMKIEVAYDYYSCAAKEENGIWALRQCLVQQKKELAEARSMGLVRKLIRRIRRR